MPRKLLFDIEDVDLESTRFTHDDIRATIPQRFEFEQLTSIVLFEPEGDRAIGLREIAEDEFWVRGHVPGLPIFPAVLMLEAAAQLCAFYTYVVTGGRDLSAFAGIDKARFRGVVERGSKLYILLRAKSVSRVRSSFTTQGIVNGEVVFEAGILGVRLPGVSLDEIAKNDTSE